MTDKIILSGIELYAYGGVTNEEKTIGQRYRVDVTLELDLSDASRTDEIERTVHYGHVYGVVVETARSRRFNLVESLAGRIADRLLQRFPETERVTVRVAKLLPPIDGIVASAAVELARERPGADPTSELRAN